jgi:hypothetical protein
MSVSRDMLEDQLQHCEKQLGGLNSFIKELNGMTAKHGTEPAHFEEDLFEAEHNVKFYEGEAARLKKELENLGGGGAAPAPKGAGPLSSLPVKTGIGALILSSISFVLGALVGRGMQSRRGRDETEEKN